MKDDQWFEPGDKVMRVAHEPHGSFCNSGLKRTPFGKVFTVNYCMPLVDGNAVFLIGIPSPERGVRAANFRKVKEIQLCVSAAKHVKKPKRVEVETV